MTPIAYVRRKQTSSAIPDGRWHVVRVSPGDFPWRAFGDLSPNQRDKILQEWREWRVWVQRPQTFCGQAYIEKYWIKTTTPDTWRTCCEDCWAEVAAWRLRGN